MPYSGSLLHSGSVGPLGSPISARTGSRDAVASFRLIMIECGASHVF